MKITSSKGKNNKIHISADGEYMLTVDADFWYSCGVREGEEMDESDFAEFRDKILSRRAFNAAADLLDLRDYGSVELSRKLVTKGHRKEYADAAVARLQELGLVDDTRYAVGMAEYLSSRKGYSPKRVISELISRGISREIASIAAESIDKDNISAIIDLLNSKYRRFSENEKERKRAFNALLRLGYRRSDINNAMNNPDDGFPEE